MRWWLAAVVLTTGMFGVNPAYALTTGLCAPAAQVRSALAAENMNPIIVGNRTGYGYTSSYIFFANADLSRGYLVRGDKPLGQQSETACIDSVYRDVRINDVARPGVPTWALMPSTNARTATAICHRDHLGYQERCGGNDDAINGQNGNGLRVMLVATGTAINPRDRSIRQGQRIILALDGNDRTGLVMAATPEGANYILSAYASGAFSQFGSDALARQR